MFLWNHVQLPSELTRQCRTTAWVQALWCYGGLLGEQQIFHGPTAVCSSFMTTGFTSKKGCPTLKNNLKIRNVSQLFTRIFLSRVVFESLPAPAHGQLGQR